MKRILASMIAATVLAGGAAEAVWAKKTTVTFMTAAFVDQKVWKSVADAFMKSNSDIQIKLLPGGGDTVRLLTLMAGGVGPDLSIFDQSISTYALRNLLYPLDSFLRKDGIKASDFWNATWKEGLWNGKVWALGWMTHANFACLINDKLFLEAGLEPKAPKTVSELDMIAGKLTTKDDKGMLKTTALTPWVVYGGANAVYTWGWIFGGDFYDAAAKKITCAEPRIEKAMKWVYDYANRFGGMSKFGGVEKDRWLKGSGIYNFFQQRVAMTFSHPGESTLIRQFTANGLKISMGKMPVNEGVTDAPAWVGGWKMGIVPSSKNKEAAWRFLKFMTADPTGSSLLCSATGELPSYKKATIYETYKTDKVHKGFMDVLEDASHVRPVIPVSDRLAANLDAALNSVMSGRRSPIDALNLAQADTQKELQRYIARYKF